MNLRSLLIVLPLLLTLTAACQSSSKQTVPMPEMDSAVGKDRCRIYMTRATQVVGRPRAIRVHVGDREIGVLQSGDFLAWESGPGRFVIRLVYEGPVLDGGDVEGLVDFEGVAGQEYYYEIKLAEEGWKPHGRLLSSDAGKELMSSRSAANIRQP